MALDIAEAGLNNGLDGRNVVIHEFSHGLGFSEFIDEATGDVGWLPRPMLSPVGPASAPRPAESVCTCPR